MAGWAHTRQSVGSQPQARTTGSGRSPRSTTTAETRPISSVLANLCRDTITEITDAARQGIARVRRESMLLFSFLRHCELEL
jgi:hypothetical protein